MKVKIGFVQKPFGIKGEVKIKPTTDFVEERYQVGETIELVLNQEVKSLVIESIRNHQGSLLVKFEGLDNLNDVEFFHRAEIQIDRETMHDLEEDEYYFVDLVGCEVYDDEKLLGTVKEVMDMPAHPVLRIKTQSDDILIPFVERFIDSVSLDDKEIKIRFMEGLF